MKLPILKQLEIRLLSFGLTCLIWSKLQILSKALKYVCTHVHSHKKYSIGCNAKYVLKRLNIAAQIEDALILQVIANFL